MSFKLRMQKQMMYYASVLLAYSPVVLNSTWVTNYYLILLVLVFLALRLPADGLQHNQTGPLGPIRVLLL
jgi:hypothetical protein